MRTSTVPDDAVRVQSILYRKKRDIGEIARVEDFVLVHQLFADVEELLGDSWTLYALDEVRF